MDPGMPFFMPSFWLQPEEYGKIVSEINHSYETLYKDKRVAAHASFGIDGEAYIYWFENRGFDDYNIFLRIMDTH